MADAQTDDSLPSSGRAGSIDRDDLLKLHMHYESVAKDNLDFCFKYLNFYVGLLSAILAGSITGLFALKPIPSLGYALLLGPALIIFLSAIGYSNLRVFYRRFIEAWVTVLNIQSLLGLTEDAFGNNPRKPMFKSRHGGGFITQFERPSVRDVLERGKEYNWTAEKVLEEVFSLGDTLRYSRLTLAGFAIAALLLSAPILFMASR